MWNINRLPTKIGIREALVSRGRKVKTSPLFYFLKPYCLYKYYVLKNISKRTKTYMMYEINYSDVLCK